MLTSRSDTSWLVHRVKESHNLRRLVARSNGLLMSTLGVRVTSIHNVDLGKEWFDRLFYFSRLLDLVEDVKGDVVECGVAGGESLAMIANVVRSSGVNRRIWGFDSWEGFPSPTEQDLASVGSHAERGGFSGVSVQSVLVTLRRFGFSDAEIQTRINLIRGFFSESLARYSGSRIALLHIDADLYQSYKDVLEYLWPKLSIGGIAAFDEYHLPEDWPGAKQAVDEFLGQLPPGAARLHKDDRYGRYYAVRTA